MKAICALFFAGAVQLQAATEWIHLTSANFEMYTGGSEREARQTLETFEQVRDFFMRVKSSQATTRLPVTIVAFRNQKEYKPYRVSESAAAYYIGDEQRDYIVMSDLGAERAPAAIHEYMHLLVRHSNFQPPLWLNEGFAEVYSTLKPTGGQILLGSVPAGRVADLANRKWLSIAALTAVGHDSAEYNEKDRAGIFYSQSWLLTHMLMFGPDYRERFSTFVAELATSGSTAMGFQKVYGKTLAAMDKDLDRYYHSHSLDGVLFKTRFQKVEIGRPVPATPLESGLTLAKLALLIGQKSEAARRLDGLAAEYKDSYQVEEARAYLVWRDGNVEGARRHFESAARLGATSWKTYWDYARLLGSDADHPDQYEQALRKTVDLHPALDEARAALGRELFRKHSYAQALVALREVKQIEPQRASSLFLMMAYCAVQLGQKQEARQYGEQARKYARSPAESANAEGFLQYLQAEPRSAPASVASAPASVASAPAPAPVPQPAAAAEPKPPAEAAETAPALKRRPKPAQAVEAPGEGPHLTARGRLLRLDCLGPVARMHVRAGAITHTLLIRTPALVTIRNSGGAPVNMRCGAQDTPVSVDYAPARDAQYQTTGEVRAIEFLK